MRAGANPPIITSGSLVTAVAVVHPRRQAASRIESVMDMMILFVGITTGELGMMHHDGQQMSAHYCCTGQQHFRLARRPRSIIVDTCSCPLRGAHARSAGALSAAVNGARCTRVRCPLLMDGKLIGNPPAAVASQLAALLLACRCAATHTGVSGANNERAGELAVHQFNSSAAASYLIISYRLQPSASLQQLREGPGLHPNRNYHYKFQ